MYSSQDKYSKMQTKLQEGLRILSEASDKDLPKLESALVRLHGALEDFVRFEIARKVPSLQPVVEDVKQSPWNILITYSKQYLGFSEYDADMITRANRRRQEVAHGGSYEGSRSELVRYAEFVQRKCNPNLPLRDLTYRETTAEPAPEVQTYPHRPPREETYEQPEEPYHVYRRPWYRSTLFLFLTFFLLPPLWAFLIVTDRRHGCFLKLVAYTVLLSTALIIYGLFMYFDNSWTTFRDALEDISIPSLPTVSPSVRGSPESEGQPSAPVAGPSTSGPSSPCTIVWEEHEPDDLGGMNRSMVWEEIVFERIKDSGMTAREFYTQVVEYNPDLVADGFEFKRGKTYLLPECQ